MLYFDHAASAPIIKDVINELQNSLINDFANSSSSHSLGRQLECKIEKMRSIFLKLVNGNDKFDFIFTGSATESNNLLIKGLELGKDDHVFFSESDHPSTTLPCRRHFKESIINIKSNSQGVYDLDQIISSISNNTRLVVLNHVNNLSGTIQNIEFISKKIKNKNPNTVIHIDAVQSFGKIPIDLSSLTVDSVTISSHKIGGPKGIAGLYIKKNLTITPLLDGGGHEFGLRSSTLAYPLMRGFVKAAEISIFELLESEKKIKELYNILANGIKKISNTLLFPFEFCASPYICTFILPGISSDIIMRHLERRNIFISTTSACSSKNKSENPAYNSLQIAKKFHNNVFRVSMGRSTTVSEVREFIENFIIIFNEIKHLIKK